MAGRPGDNPIVGTGVGLVVFPILPSMAFRCVILKVPGSWCVSDTVGVFSSNDEPANMLSPSSMEISWIPTVDCISVVPVMSASGDSSDGMLSAFKSSVSTVDVWCLIEGLLRGRSEASRAAVAATAAAAAAFDGAIGRTVGERSCGRGSGVVGEVG